MPVAVELSSDDLQRILSTLEGIGKRKMPIIEVLRSYGTTPMKALEELKNVLTAAEWESVRKRFVAELTE